MYGFHYREFTCIRPLVTNMAVNNPLARVNAKAFKWFLAIDSKTKPKSVRQANARKSTCTRKIPNPSIPYSKTEFDWPQKTWLRCSVYNFGFWESDQKRFKGRLFFVYMGSLELEKLFEKTTVKDYQVLCVQMAERLLGLSRWGQRDTNSSVLASHTDKF